MTFFKQPTQKLPIVWALILWLCLGLVSAKIDTRVFDLPTMQLSLSTKNADRNFAIFEDALTAEIQKHLVVFYKEKVDKPLPQSKVTIDHVFISSNYVWRELPVDLSKPDPDLMKRYQVQGTFVAQLKVTLDYLGLAPLHVSQSQMELFFVESFQQDNYWALVHEFLSDEILAGISDVQIAVQSEGYIPFGKDDPTEAGVEKEGWDISTMIGVFFATFFCISLAMIWIYMYFNLREEGKDSATAASATDQDSTDCEMRVHEGGESSWMDNWAKSVTSIPLRDPAKSRKSKKFRYRPTPKPSQISLSLDCITEGVDEDASVCSISSNHTEQKRVVKTDASTASYESIRTPLKLATSGLTNIDEEATQPSLFPDHLTKRQSRRNRQEI